MRYIAEQDIKDNSYKTIKKTQNLYTESVIKSSIEDLGKINEEQVRENTNIIRKIKRATTLSRTKYTGFICDRGVGYTIFWFKLII